jgi:hypothetical protein
MIQAVTVDCEPGGNKEMGGPVGHHRRSQPVTKTGCEPAWRCTTAAAGVVDVVRAKHSWDAGSGVCWWSGTAGIAGCRCLLMWMRHSGMLAR